MHSSLKYVILNPRQPLSLSIFEAEKYENAIVVQQLVGTLVYHSNFGKYEPRLATAWEHTNPNTWIFNLRSGLRCEDGEEITPESFKRSLERSIHLFSKIGEIPFLSSLKGYSSFVANNKNVLKLDDLTSIDGIVAHRNSIIFHFNMETKDGLLEILAFSPFGYVSAKNYNERGGWLDDSEFVSSGPYKVAEAKQSFRLVRNSFWPDFMNEVPETLVFSHQLDSSENSIHTIVDTFTSDVEVKKLKQFPLTPEYINSVILGNIETGYFKDVEVRRAFKKVFEENRDRLLPLKFGSNIRASSFYPAELKHRPEAVPQNKVMEKPFKPLIIEGSLPEKGTPRAAAWVVLQSTLTELKIPFEFANNNSSFEYITNKNFDVRIRGASIGKKVEAWGVRVAFVSPVGINFPDPLGRIEKLLKRLEDGQINELQFETEFLNLVDREAAILPVSHYGVNLYLSTGIDANSFNADLAIMKFDQMRLVAK